MKEVFRKAIIQLDIACYPCLIPPLASALLQLQTSYHDLERYWTIRALSLFFSALSPVDR